LININSKNLVVNKIFYYDLKIILLVIDLGILFSPLLANKFTYKMLTMVSV
jgi:hypothetical protein